MTTWPYDLTAEFYDLDMGLNAAAGSVAWYLAQAQAAVVRCGGAVLELGCGTGRVTLPLAQAGLSMVGIDRSWPMLQVLQAKAQRSGLAQAVQLAVMDMGRMAWGQRFAAVLCPFSALGYLVDAPQLDSLLASVRRCLLPGGRLVLDMFIPDPALQHWPPGVEVQDYRRSLPPGPWSPATELVRSKSIQREVAPGVHRIDRRYRFMDASGALQQELVTHSHQRGHTPQALRALLAAGGLEVVAACGDFDPARPAAWPSGAACMVAQVAQVARP